MPSKQQRCTYCEAPATLLCDYVLGWPVFSRDENGKDRPPHTCDLPMCAKCGKRQGVMHVRLSQKVNGRRGFFDSIDHCLEHGNESMYPTKRITDAEAERRHREIRAAAERRALDNGVMPMPRTADDQLQLF